MAVSRQVRRQEARQAAKGGTFKVLYSGPEKLVECAYRTPAGEVTHGCESHAELLNYEPKNPYDTYGFWTSQDRFVTRAEAVPIGVAARQLSESWLNVSRELLSSDIRW